MSNWRTPFIVNQANRVNDNDDGYISFNNDYNNNFDNDDNAGDNNTNKENNKNNNTDSWLNILCYIP